MSTVAASAALRVFRQPSEPILPSFGETFVSPTYFESRCASRKGVYSVTLSANSNDTTSSRAPRSSSVVMSPGNGRRRGSFRWTSRSPSGQLVEIQNLFEPRPVWQPARAQRRRALPVASEQFALRADHETFRCAERGGGAPGGQREAPSAMLPVKYSGSKEANAEGAKGAGRTSRTGSPLRGIVSGFV